MPRRTTQVSGNLKDCSQLVFILVFLVEIFVQLGTTRAEALVAIHPSPLGGSRW